MIKKKQPGKKIALFFTCLFLLSGCIFLPDSVKQELESGDNAENNNFKKQIEPDSLRGASKR